MLWKMKRLHLIFVILVLWGDTNGIPVWNRTSVVDWQDGPSYTPWTQTVQLPTHVRPFALQSVVGGNGHVEGGRFSSVQLTSDVQAAQGDSSSVQSSAGAAHDVSLPCAQSRGTQNTVTSLPSRLSWLEALRQTDGTLVSQSQSPANTNMPYGAQSSAQPSMVTGGTAGQFTIAQSSGASNPNQMSGRYTILQGQLRPSPAHVSGHQSQASYQPSTATQFAAGPSASTAQAQSSGALGLSHGPSSGSHLTSMGQNILSTSQSAVSTNNLLGSQASYQPSNITQALSGQYVSTSQAQSSGASYQPSTVTQVSAGHSAAALSSAPSYPNRTSGRFSIFQGSMSTSPFPLYGDQSQLKEQPSTATQLAASQPVSTAQSSGASILYQGLTSGSYQTSIGQSIPASSQSGFHTHQPSAATQVSAVPLASAQSLGASYPSQSSGRCTILQSPLSQSPARVSGYQAQTSYQPSTDTLLSGGQPASTSLAQSAGVSMLYHGPTSGNYITSMGQSIPSTSQSALFTNEISGSQASHQPSPITQASSGQSVSTSLAQSSGGSYHPSTATQVSVGSFAAAPSLGLSYPDQTSGRFSSFQGQMSTSDSQVSGVQTLTGQSLVAQAPFSSKVESSGSVKWYTIIQPRIKSVPFQSVGTATQISGFQTQSTNQPNCASQVLAGQSTSAQAPSLGTSYPSQTSGRYTILQGQSSQLSGFQTQSSHQPSTNMWFTASQPASTSLSQSFGSSLLNEGLTSGRYLAMGQSRPSAPQSAASTNQAYGSQTSYQPIRTQFSPGQFTFTGGSQ